MSSEVISPEAIKSVFSEMAEHAGAGVDMDKLKEQLLNEYLRQHIDKFDLSNGNVVVKNNQVVLKFDCHATLTIPVYLDQTGHILSSETAEETRQGHNADEGDHMHQHIDDAGKHAEQESRGF